MKRIFLFGCMVMSALALASCETDDNGPVPPAKPIELDTRSAEKVAADNAFAFDLFRQTLATAPEKDKTNAFVSPLSVTMALGMLYNGTSPTAAAEMEEALGMSDFSAEEINAHYQTLMKALLAADPKTALAIANSIWAREGFSVKPAFYDVNRTYYDAEVQSRDFDLQATLDEINKWCSDNTNTRIPKILDKIPQQAVMYLINAVYFKGLWKFEFSENDTRDHDFRLAGGETKSVKMMSQETDLPVYWGETLQCVDLPYGNGAFSMMVVMPSDENGSLDDLVAEFDADTYNSAVDGLSERGILLKLPRWKQECEFSLNDAAKNLGMERIFQEGGNLSGINDDPRLIVSEIKHKTFVEVNEQGTEAAAITSIGIEFTSVKPSGPPSFIADRPFLYIIRERSTGAILFIGRIDNPQI